MIQKEKNSEKNGTDKYSHKYTCITLICTLITGLTDIMTPAHLNFYPLYLISVFLIVRYSRIHYLPFVFLTSVVSMLISEYTMHKAIGFHAVWNMFMILMMFAIFTAILLKLRFEQNIVRNQKKKLEQQLDEKSILIREIYHRLKNNISMLISLINLQSKMSDNNNNNVLEDIKKRLYVFSALFEKLCYSKDSEKEINICIYLSELAKIIEKSSVRKAAISVKECKIFINNRYATTIGLILNELITNTMKYSFPKNDDTIRIDIDIKQEQNMLILHYHDNGRSFDYQNKPSDSENHFGFFLINTLMTPLIYYCLKFQTLFSSHRQNMKIISILKIRF